MESIISCSNVLAFTWNFDEVVQNKVISGLCLSEKLCNVCRQSKRVGIKVTWLANLFSTVKGQRQNMNNYVVQELERSLSMFFFSNKSEILLIQIPLSNTDVNTYVNPRDCVLKKNNPVFHIRKGTKFLLTEFNKFRNQSVMSMFRSAKKRRAIRGQRWDFLILDTREGFIFWVRDWRLRYEKGDAESLCSDDAVETFM